MKAGTLVTLRHGGIVTSMVSQSIAAVALGLIAASGIAKLVDPQPTTVAMRSAGLPASALLTTLLAGGEVVSGSLGLAGSAIAAWIAAFLYLSFAVFTFAAVRNRIPVQSCGCFGRDDTPPTWIHVGFNAVAAAALVYTAAEGRNVVDWTLPVGELVLYAAFVGAGSYAAYLLLFEMPKVTHRQVAG